MLGLGNKLPRGGVLSSFENVYSLDFDGSNDYVDTGHHFSTVFDGSFTLSAWLKPDDGQPSANEMAMGVKDNSSSARISFLLKTDGKFLFTYESNDGAYTDVLTDSAVWSNGESTWKHIVVTINETNGAIVIYVNGSSTKTGTEDEYDDMSTFSADANFYIGSRNNDGSQDLGWAGLIDEVGIWDAALDADAVSAIYNSGTPIPLDSDLGNYDNSGDLQGWWRFEEGSGTTAIDTTGNNNGTLTNGPAYSAVVPS